MSEEWFNLIIEEEKFEEFLKETPTMNTDPNGTETGFSQSAVVQSGFDKTLWHYMVTNVYQSPADLNYRWSNIFPVKKLSLEDIDNTG